MSFFCLLWLPLFYLFWRSVIKDNSSAGGVWALLGGSIISIIQFFLGSLVEPGGFGLSRWVSACVDIVTLPALLPILICFLLVAVKIIAGTTDFTSFTLLWLIPGGAIRALSWSHLNDPTLLVLVPILWTAIAVGVPFFINFIKSGLIFAIIASILAMLVIPLAAASSYWAFYTQKSYLGLFFLLLATGPMLVAVILSFISASD